MFQNLFGEDTIINGPRKTVSNEQFTELSGSRILSQEDKPSLKKVMSLNNAEKETKTTNKTDHKALKVKLTKYKNAQKDFEIASNKLNESYTTFKKLWTDSVLDKNDTEFEELETIVIYNDSYCL